jgi:hypothetical protein
MTDLPGPAVISKKEVQMFRTLTTAALAVTIAASNAGAAVLASEFALPVSDFASTAVRLAPAASPIVEPVPVTFAGVVYQPRPHTTTQPVSAPVMQQGPRSQVQIHGGVFAPDGALSDGFVVGLRGGPMLSPNAQVGLSADWQYRSAEQAQPISTTTGPGGTPINTSRTLSSFSESTFPMLAFLQLSVDPQRFIAPYAGIGGGYEIVTLSASDYVNASSFNATYGNWGWQAWAGARLKVASQAGVFAEAYRNECTAQRNVYDSVSGLTLRESVNVNGVGVRAGLSFVM